MGNSQKIPSSAGEHQTPTHGDSVGSQPPHTVKRLVVLPLPDPNSSSQSFDAPELEKHQYLSAGICEYNFFAYTDDRQFIACTLSNKCAVRNMSHPEGLGLVAQVSVGNTGSLILSTNGEVFGHNVLSQFDPNCAVEFGRIPALSGRTCRYVMAGYECFFVITKENNKQEVCMQKHLDVCMYVCEREV